MSFTLVDPGEAPRRALASTVAIGEPTEQTMLEAMIPDRGGLLFDKFLNLGPFVCQVSQANAVGYVAQFGMGFLEPFDRHRPSIGISVGAEPTIAATTSRTHTSVMAVPVSVMASETDLRRLLDMSFDLLDFLPPVPRQPVGTGAEWTTRIQKTIADRPVEMITQHRLAHVTPEGRALMILDSEFEGTNRRDDGEARDVAIAIRSHAVIEYQTGAIAPTSRRLVLRGVAAHENEPHSFDPLRFVAHSPNTTPLGFPAWFELLDEALAPSNSSARSALVAGLGRLGDPTAIPELLALETQGDSELERLRDAALEEITGRPERGHLDVIDAAHALERQGLEGPAFALLEDHAKRREPTDEATLALLLERARLLAHAGRYSEANAQFSDLHQRVRRHPAVLAAYAYWLATAPAEEFRNGKKALALARSIAAKHDPRGDVARALAAAYARVGRYQLARSHQEKAIKQAKDAKLAFPITSAYERELESYQDDSPFEAPSLPSEEP